MTAATSVLRILMRDERIEDKSVSSSNERAAIPDDKEGPPGSEERWFNSCDECAKNLEETREGELGAPINSCHERAASPDDKGDARIEEAVSTAVTAVQGI